LAIETGDLDRETRSAFVTDAIHVIRRPQHIGGQGNAAEQRAGIENERNRWHIGRILKRGR
jgi:hypothetical protein